MGNTIRHQAGASASPEVPQCRGARCHSMEERLHFVRDVPSGLFTMTELAEQYAISRRTGYKWLDRYDADGTDGLHDQSRRPHHSPTATADEVIEQLVALRRRHPRWGP